MPPADRAFTHRADPTLHLRRHALGALALLLMAGAAFFHLRPPENSFEQMCQAACWRMGPITALIWLTYYQLIQLPAWLVAALPILLVVVVLRPKFLLFLMPAILLIFFLRPRVRKPVVRR